MKSKLLIILFVIINIMSFGQSRTRISDDPGIPQRDGVQLEQEPENDETPRYNLKIFIKVHKVVFEQQESILVQFFVKNQERKVIDLKIADMFFLNFSFTVKNLQNQMMSEKNEFFLYKQENERNRNYRTVRLAPGDIYGKTVNLSDIFNFDKIGFYVIQGYFYPVPFGFHDINSYPSNTIRVNVHYGQRRMAIARQIARQEQQEVEKVRNPNETIEFMLNAKLKKNWEHFFRYMDLSRVIELYPDFYRQYSSIQPSKRKALMEKFKEYLKDYLEEQMVSFDVYRTVINREDAIVYTNIIYEHRSVKYKKRYVFQLNKRGNYWYLYHFYVMNLRLSRQEYEADIERRQEQVREQRESEGAVPIYD